MSSIPENTFAAACYDQLTVAGLVSAYRRHEADATDCKTWNITPEEWRSAIKLALGVKLTAGQDDINDRALQTAVESVEENNRANGAAWSDWDSAGHVCDVYEINVCEAGRAILDRAIKSNGASLKIDLPAVELVVYGKNFSGSFWDR